MSSRPETNRAARLIAAAGAIAGLLAGCADPGLYLDRRDSIGLGAGDAVAANAALQTVDPWPPQSGNTHLATNGQRMQTAVERYRTNQVTQPVDPMMLQTANQTPMTVQVNNNQPTVPSTVTTAGGSNGSSSTSSAGSSGP
jgi:hypothetical protein